MRPCSRERARERREPVDECTMTYLKKTKLRQDFVHVYPQCPTRLYHLWAMISILLMIRTVAKEVSSFLLE